MDVHIRGILVYKAPNLLAACFEIYLKDRQQFISINVKSPYLQMIKTGVPKVSTLGPFLFLIFINDLP